MGWRWCGLKLINFVLEKIICRLWSDSQVVMSVSSKSICFLKLKSFLQGITSDTSSANNVEGPSSSFGKSFMYSKKYTFENATLEDGLCYYFFTWSYSTYIARCKVAMLHLNTASDLQSRKKTNLGRFLRPMAYNFFKRIWFVWCIGFAHVSQVAYGVFL